MGTRTIVLFMIAALPIVASGCSGPAKTVAPSSEQPAQKWEAGGIRVVRISRAMNGMMLDLRYRITDLGQAEKVLTRNSRLELIDQRSGTVLVVPDTAKVGKLRQLPNEQTKDRLFWVFFDNSGMKIKQGDKVTLKVDGLMIKDIVVQ